MRPASVDNRRSEDARPIFWASLQNFYLDRAWDWDAFPTGHWSNFASPALGDLSDYDLLGSGGW
jgi:methylenetetrahydrofolate reductase (NADPH)